ncbi:MAG: SRPBCC family protein [Chloroflexi bacterium]|nr:SRPBCC family protein [Chloroflexota bacterium]
MPVVTRSIYIEAPADRVFAYLEDVERHIEWSGKLGFGLERIEKLTPGPLMAGSVFKSVGRPLSRAGVEDTSTVTETQPNRRLAWETVTSGVRRQDTFRWACTLEPQGQGTRLTYSLEGRTFTPKPLRLWFPPLLWFIDHQIFGREMTVSLQKIKDALEQ